MARAPTAVRPTADLQWAIVRLRPLTEAECYARCYGGRQTEAVTVVDAQGREIFLPPAVESARVLFDRAVLGVEAGTDLEAA